MHTPCRGLQQSVNLRSLCFTDVGIHPPHALVPALASLPQLQQLRLEQRAHVCVCVCVSVCVCARSRSRGHEDAILQCSIPCLGHNAKREDLCLRRISAHPRTHSSPQGMEPLEVAGLGMALAGGQVEELHFALPFEQAAAVVAEVRACHGVGFGQRCRVRGAPRC